MEIEANTLYDRSDFEVIMNFIFEITHINSIAMNIISYVRKPYIKFKIIKYKKS